MNAGRVTASLLICFGVPAAAVRATPFVDDFNADSSANYVRSTVLYTANTTGTPVSTIDAADGNTLVHTVTGFAGAAVQSLTLHKTASLGIGETLLLDFVSTAGLTSGNETIGLAVSLSGDPADALPSQAAQSDVRQDFYSVGYRPTSATRINSERFGPGTTNQGTAPVTVTGTISGVYITRTGEDTFVGGNIDGTGSLVQRTTYTDANFTPAGAFVGLYSDIRTAGYSATVDNLRIVTAVPEPTAATALAAAALLTARRRRRA